MSIPVKIYVVPATLALISVIGCSNGTKIERGYPLTSIDNYRVNMPDAEIMPSLAELKGLSKSFAIFPLKVDSRLKVGSGVARQFSTELQNALHLAGFETVESGTGTIMANDSKIGKNAGELTGAGNDSADAAIMPTLQDFRLVRTFSPASESSDDDGQRLSFPASCRYEVTVTGKVTIFDFSETTKTESVTQQGEATTSMVSNDEACPLNEEDAVNLTSRAIKNTVQFIMPTIQQKFSQPGYVMEYRKRGDLHLVKITLGKEQDLNVGQKIYFATRLPMANYSGGEPYIKTYRYDFQGVVSDMINDNSAWVEVDREAEVQLKRGDLAKIHDGVDCNYPSFLVHKGIDAVLRNLN